MAVVVPFLVQIFIAVAVAVIAYALMPKPKTQKPQAAQDLESPTAQAGRPIPVPFGRIRIKGVNILYTGDKEVFEWQQKA